MNYAARGATIVCGDSHYLLPMGFVLSIWYGTSEVEMVLWLPNV